MNTVAEVSFEDATKPALSPARRRWVREGALLMIWNGADTGSIPFHGDERELIAGEMDALRAEGVGPKRAERMHARLKAGLYAIEGGGESAPRTDSRRPLLALVRAL